MSATSVSKGNMHNMLRQIIKLLTSIDDSLKELNKKNKPVEIHTEIRGNKGFNNDSLRTKQQRNTNDSH
ncbi:hypothetical protein SEA_NICEHOUSE_216 [Rhodococcus phage NiceHouse]|nr:hypothetical protein SEA_NICEHOUSE_216 [Rhodococcus phage NiceHouse]